MDSRSNLAAQIRMIPHVRRRSSGSKLTPIVLTAAVTGAILGILLAHALFLGWWTLVPWGIGGLALGYNAKRQFVLTGIAYGFVLVFVFLISQYNGTPSLVTRLPGFALFAIFGGFCGLVLTTAGFFMSRLRGFR